MTQCMKARLWFYHAVYAVHKMIMLSIFLNVNVQRQILSKPIQCERWVFKMLNLW